MNTAEVVSPATGEVHPFDEACAVDGFDIARCDELFLITENGKRFSVRQNELFKVESGIYFVRLNQRLGLLTQGPFTSDIRFPKARENLGQWLQDFLKQGFGLKGADPRAVARDLARAVAFVLIVYTFAFLILPKAFSTSIAEAPTISGFDKKVGHVFVALEKAVRAAPFEILKPARVMLPQVTKKIVSKGRQSAKCTKATESLDPDVLEFLTTKQRVAMRVGHGGECESKK